jgi:hypothetical protein
VNIWNWVVQRHKQSMQISKVGSMCKQEGVTEKARRGYIKNQKQ